MSLFSRKFEHGQRMLFNVLHAYSVADEEVGYCQGMNFIASLFIMHVSFIDCSVLLKFCFINKQSPREVDAYNMLWAYMNVYGFKEFYKSNMTALEVRLIYCI